jgi:hypothetical protein
MAKDFRLAKAFSTDRFQSKWVAVFERRIMAEGGLTLPRSESGMRMIAWGHFLLPNRSCKAQALSSRSSSAASSGAMAAITSFAD